MVSTSLQATQAGVLSRSGAPFGPVSKGSPPIVLPSRSWDLKKLNAIPCWPLPRTLSANSPVSLMTACAPESVFTPKTTRGGAKAAWVTQLTVAAATAPFLPSAVKTYRPYGIMRNAVFLASSFIDSPPLYFEERRHPYFYTFRPSVTPSVTSFIPQTGTQRKPSSSLRPRALPGCRPVPASLSWESYASL